jgi:type I restriction enzyme, S subunit
MASEWRTYRLGDLFTLHPGFAFRSQSFVSTGVPVIKIKNVKPNRLDLNDLSFVDESFLKSQSNYIIRRGDILITLSGNRFDGSKETWVGKIAQFRESGHYLLNQRVAVLREKSGSPVDTRCCAYILSSDVYQQLFIAIATSSGGQANLSSAQVLETEIKLPPLRVQHAVANTLGALDDKIVLNGQMNGTLESTARALFTSWFIDFDPVRAKTKGRECGHLGSLANLFPDSLVASAGQEIPKDWSLRPFAETVEIIGGGTPKTNVSEYWNGGIPWFSVVDAPCDSDIWVIDTEKKISQAGVDNSSTKILSEGTTIISARGTVGRVGLVGVPMAMNQSCYGLKGNVGSRGTFTYFSTRMIVSDLQRQAHGSVFDTITRNTFEGVRTAIPPMPLVMAFEEKIDPLLQRVRINLFQSHTLAATRDALLPKLASGELSILDADRIIGGAA